LEDLREFIERSPVAMLAFGLPGQRVGFGNEAVAELIGSPQSALVGLEPSHVFDGADGRRSRVAMSALRVRAAEGYWAHHQLLTSRGPLPVSVWGRRMELVGEAVVVVIVVPESEPKVVIASLGALLGPEAVDLAVGTLNRDRRIDPVSPPSGKVPGQDQQPADMDLASVVHPSDVDRLLSAIRRTAETAEDAVVRVRLRHAEHGWTETRCLFFPLPEDPNRSLGFVLAGTATDAPPATDDERIATLERHLLSFAAELHRGWRNAQPPVDASRFAALYQLPRRQREVVDRLVRGERISSIAASMYLSASTVRNHLSHAFSAFGVHNQSELLSLLQSDSDTA
jgi:DNA-binding CsgD family transcriptional regulator